MIWIRNWCWDVVNHPYMIIWVITILYFSYKLVWWHCSSGVIVTKNSISTCMGFTNNWDSFWHCNSPPIIIKFYNQNYCSIRLYEKKCWCVNIKNKMLSKNTWLNLNNTICWMIIKSKHPRGCLPEVVVRHWRDRPEIQWRCATDSKVIHRHWIDRLMGRAKQILCNRNLSFQFTNNFNNI